MMTIRWQVKTKGRTYAVRNSTHPLYVPHASRRRPRYLSLVDLTTRAAGGEDDAQHDVFDAIWFDFGARDIHPRTLDPSPAPSTVDRDVLQYWTPWTLLDDYLLPRRRR